MVEDLFLKKRNAVCSLTTAQSMEPFDLDLLKEGSWSNVLFSLRRYSAEGYKFARTRTPQEIKSDVLSSRRVKHVIEKVGFLGFCYSFTQERRSLPIIANYH